MKTQARNGFGTRMLAVLMLAIVLLSAACFGPRNVGGRGASLSMTPVVVEARADDGNNINDIFNIVDKDKNGNITVSVDKDADANLGGLVDKSKVLAQVILGLATVASIVFLIINIAKMSAAGANEANRKKAQTGILWSGIALALFGGLSFVVGFFWNLLMGL